MTTSTALPYAAADNAGTPDERSSLVREQHRSLTRQMPTMYVMLMMNTAFIAIFSIGSVPLFLSLLIPGIVTLGLIARLLIWVRRRNRPAHSLSIPEIKAQLRGTLIASCLLSLAICAWSIALFYFSEGQFRTLVPFFAVMSMVTCGYCLVALPRATDAVIGLGTMPIALTLFIAGDTHLRVLAVNMLLVAAMVRYMVRGQYEQLCHLVSSWSKVEQKQARVHELAYIDDLTGLPNRRAFLAELARAGRNGDQLGVIMLDLDGFKPVNDTYGHAAGDELLIGTADRLQTALPEETLLARLGGDEFAILHPNARTPEDMLRLARMVHQLFEAPFTIGTQQFRIGSSVGVTHALLDNEGTAGLIHQADLALYDAKRRKATIPVLFSAPMAAAVRRRMAIEQALADNRLDSQISLAFQPFINPRTKATAGFEALARWNHPTLGALSPGEFIAIAEQCGMIDTLTTSLFRRAIDAANQWPQELALSFNLSAAEVGSPTLVGRIAEIMAERNFDPARLAIEVTETALLNDIDYSRATIEALRSTGAQVWLDDFGAGYSSIGYLRDMAFDAIKLDGSLLKDVVTNPARRNLLIGVIHLCEAIRAPVIVEMVESEDQLRLLRSLPIAMVQGHFLSPGLTEDAARQWAREPGSRLENLLRLA